MARTTNQASRALEDRAREIVEARGGHWSRGQGTCCCPAHDDRTPSLAIGLSPRAILFHCFAGCTSAEVLAAFRRLGVKPSEFFNGGGEALAPLPAWGAVPSRNAQRLWRESVPVTGSLAERYLSGRWIDRRSPDLRFHPLTPLGRKPDTRFLPAMLAAVRTDVGIVAVQRTFLDPVPAAKANFFKPRRTLGAPGIGAVRLFPPKAGRLGLAEGAESAMSATILHEIPCWATLGNERFGIAAVPDSVTELHLFIDADKGGDLSLTRGREAYARPGRSIIPHRPDREGDDWNDVLRRQRTRLAAA